MAQNALRKPEEELSDDDIIEVIEPVPGSGMYPAAPPPLPARAEEASAEELPRMGSMTDGVATNVSDLVPELARLSDPLTMPRISADAPEGDVAPAEALIMSLVEANMTVEHIVGVSPLTEEETLRVLSKLVGKGSITVDQR
jgi:hypothetical protein